MSSNNNNTPSSPPPLSRRAQEWLSKEYGLIEGMRMAYADPYHATKNPRGIINCGVAENKMMFAEMAAKCDATRLPLREKDAQYDDFLGLEEVRASLAKFLNKHLRPRQPIDADEVAVTNGCSSAVESLFHTLCDDGDYVLCPTPYYGGFDFDLERRVRAHIAPVHLHSRDGFALTVSKVREAYDRVGGGRVRALLLMNPHNPLGTIMSPQLIRDLLAFCHEKRIHLVMDEIYALSIIDETAQPAFESVLLFDWPDPLAVHVIWGMSKDFCVNGFRFGAVITKNHSVRKAMGALAAFTSVPSLSQRLVQAILDDRGFADNFLNTNRQRLRECLDVLLSSIRDFNASQPTGLHVHYVKPSAGFYVWIDLSAFTVAGTTTTTEVVAAERQLFLQLIKHGKVYISPGHMAFHAQEPGWFRLVFATPVEELREALRRIFETLIQWRQ